MDRKNRNKLFQQELNALKEQNYIQEEQYQSVQQAYKAYQDDIEQKEREDILRAVQAAEKKETVPVRVEKPKVVRSPQEIRERNITWLLILGVIMLFIGGLVFATNNWETMNAFTKTISIGLISGIFFGMQFITEKVLHIKKTSFAFSVLGSLFVPITVLSAGYFELFGNWLSINGEGKYVIGLIGTLVSLPVYLLQAKKYHARLYIWFSLLTMSLGVGFLLQLFSFSKDAFYLGIALYNGLLLYGYYRFKEKKKWSLLIKEIPLFAQLNLIISTLLTLLFYENEVFYGFNLLLTAIVYMAMIFVYKEKNYHFVCSGLIVYGLYQLIEHSFLESLDFILFAAIGFIFLGVKWDMQKIFQYTSAIVSGCAFLFITAQGFIFQADKPTWLLFFAYGLISLNFIFLSNQTKQILFRYLAPIFFALSLYQLSRMAEEWNWIEDSWFGLYFVGMILFFTGHYFNKWKIVETVKESSFYVSWISMFLSVFSQLQTNHSGHLAFLLFLTSMVAFLVSKEKEEWKQTICLYLSPITFVLSLWISYRNITEHYPFYQLQLGIPFHFTLSGIMVLLVAYVLKWKKDKIFMYYFYTAYMSYTAGLLSMMFFNINNSVMIALLSMGIALYVWFEKETKEKWVWGFVSITILADYYQIVGSISMESIIGSFVLLGIMEMVSRKKKEVFPYFYYLTHLNLLYSLISHHMENQIETIIFYILSIFIYVYSVKKSRYNIEKIGMLYMSYLMMYDLVCSGIEQTKIAFLTPYTMLITSVLLSLVWLKTKSTIRTYTLYYVIVQSILGISLMNMEENSIVLIFVTSIYVAFPLYFIQKTKWSFLSIVPLILLCISINRLSYIEYISHSLIFYVYIGLFFLLKETGQLLSNRLWKKETWFFDWYALFSVYAIFNTVPLLNEEEPLWKLLIPGCLFVYFFYSQIKRMEKEWQRKIAITITALSIFYPYYTWINTLSISPLLETEVYVLPWIVYTIVLSKKTWNAYALMMSRVQLSVLLIITVILLKDALDSNTIYDAIIMGSLSIGSLLGGIHYKVKSYFFVGSGVLLLNIFLQTKPFWGNMPWWTYLLVGGMVLIAFASFYEWQKERKNERGETFIQQKKHQLLQSFKNWT